MNPPKISVGITCFNASETIARAIISAVKQDWENKELIVVDDHSTDGSFDIINNLALEYPGLKVVRHETNMGYPSSLNTIIHESSGDFIAFFDDDDVSDEDRLTKQYLRITEYEKSNNNNKLLCMCYTNRFIIKGDLQDARNHIGYAIGRMEPEPNGREVVDYILGVMPVDKQKVWGLFGSCTLMLRRGCIEQVGLFDVAFRRCAEWDFAIRAACLGAFFVSVDQPLVKQYKTNSSDKMNKIPLKYSLLLREKHQKLFDGNRTYYASLLIARSNFYGNRKKHIRSILFLLTAAALKPLLYMKKTMNFFKYKFS